MDKIVIHVHLYSTKNARMFRRLKDGRTILSKVYRVQKMEKILDLELTKHKAEWYEMVKDKKYPLKVGFYVYRGNRQRWDWQNIIQGMADALVRNGYIEDDNAALFTPYYIGWDIDKDDPRVEISVL